MRLWDLRIAENTQWLVPNISLLLLPYSSHALSTCKSTQVSGVVNLAARFMCAALNNKEYTPFQHKLYIYIYIYIYTYIYIYQNLFYCLSLD